MPQLNGSEQKTLVDLLVEHLTEPDHLDRSLLHSGLGNLSTFTQKGTLPAMTSDVLRALSSQYRIMEFVEAVLQGDYLKGHCPPIEAWLVANREELLRRKNRRLPIPSLTNLWWGLLPIAVLLMWWGYTNYQHVLESFRGKTIVRDYEIGEITIEKPVLEPFRGGPIAIDSLTVLVELERTRSTQVLSDLQEKIRKVAEVDKHYGLYYLSAPLDKDLVDPTVKIQAFLSNNEPLKDGESIVEIHWLPPDQAHETSGPAGRENRLTEGVVTEIYTGTVPAGTILVLVYHSETNEFGEPRFQVHVK